MSRSPPGGESERPPPIPPEPSHAHFVLKEHGLGLKRIARKVGAVAAIGVTFVAATAAGVLLHVGLPPARRLAAAAVNGILSGTFRGRIDVLGVTHLQADGIDGGVLTLSDREGRRVALVEGVRVRISLLPLLTSLLSGGDTRVHVTELAIDHIDVLLHESAAGALTIAEALQPAKEGPPPPPTKGSGLDLSLSSVALAHAWVHGGMKAIPLIDADLDDLAGSFETTPDRLSVDVRSLRVGTRAMPKKADVAARLEARLVLPANAEHTSASATLAGTVGGIDVSVDGTLEGKQVDARLDLPKIAPAQLDRLFDRSPIHEDASAHVEVHGALPHLSPTVHVTVGEGTLDIAGSATLPSEGQSDTLARITVAARNLDARAASPTASASKLGLDASAMLRLSAAGAVDGSYDLHVLPGTLGARPTPEAQIAGTISPTSVRGTGHVSEPGMPSDFHFDVNPMANGGPDIAFGAYVAAQDLSKVPLLGGAVRGHVIVKADGKVALGTKRMSATLLSTVHGLDAGGSGIDQASISAAVGGTFDAPAGQLAVSGHGLHAAGYAYQVFQVTADGEAGEIQVGGNLHGGTDPAVSLKGTVGLKKGVSARDVVVTLSKDKDRITARVRSARSAGQELDVEGIRIEGAGEPLDAELHSRAGALRARVTAPGLDIPTILRIAGVKTDLKSGRVGLDVDMEATKHATRGHANVTAHDVAYGDRARGGDAKLAASFDGQHANVHLDARDASKSTVTIDTEDGHLAGGAFDPRAWKDATGRVHATANVDLQAVHRGAKGALPFDDLRGRASARLDVERDDAKRRPTVLFTGSTRDLVLTMEPKTVPNGDGTVTVVGRAFHSAGLDTLVRTSFDADSGETSLDALLSDKQGHLLEANASTTLPMKALLAGAAKNALLGTPMRAHVEVPLRSIGAIPAVFETVPLRGEVGFTLDLEGSATDPHLRALLHGRNIVDADDPTPVPISFDTAAFYDGSVARAKVVVRHAGKPVLDVTSSLALRASDVVAGSFPWEANAEAHFTKFPIGAVTGFVDENAMDGDLNGSVIVQDLHKAGRLTANLDLSNLDINGAKFGDTKTAVDVSDGSLTAEARIAQPDGYADARVTGGVTWGDAVAPSIDQKKPIDLALRAKNFRVAMIAPFVRSVVSELDGRLNADTKLHVVPGMKDGTMDGAIVLDRGLFETPTVGEELHNLRARIFMKPWGVWNVAEISADGTSGHFTANAVAHVNGLSFRSGEAHLRIAEKDKLPLAMEGMDLGTVWGQIDANAGMTSDGMRVNVDLSVPKLHITLPQSIAHGVQSTTPDPTIKVGAIEPNDVVAILPVDGSLPAPTPAPAQPTGGAPGPTIHISTHLGPDLEVRRDTTVRAYVTEGPTIDIGKDTKISGGIAIPRGYIELQGKRFEIEKGKVTFTGQPVDDPVVVATAMYEAPDGTKVYADFVGPVKTGKLTLRSEPLLSQNEILALLLFGSADGTFGQSAPPGQQGNDVTQAASLAGGLVTEGLNKAISGVSGVEVQTKVDTQESGDPRPEVEVALSREVSATIIYNLGVPPPGQNPDDTLLVVDWRFHKNYATQATVGDKGTSILDLTWKYRY